MSFTDDEPVKFDPAKPDEATVDVWNLSTENVTISLSVEGVVGVQADPPTQRAASGERVTFRLTKSAEATPSGTGLLIASAPGALVSRPLEIVGSPPAAPEPLPSSATRQVGLPVTGGSVELVQNVPPGTVPSALSPRCKTAGVDGIVTGWLTGPSDALATACLTKNTVTVIGLDEPGTWSGAADLTPGIDKGDMTLSVDVRDSVVWAFIALVVVLALVAFVDYLVQTVQRKAELQYALAQVERDAGDDYEQTRTRLTQLVPDLHPTGTTTIVGPALLLTTSTASHLDEYREAAWYERADYLVGGKHFTPIVDLVTKLKTAHEQDLASATSIKDIKLIVADSALVNASPIVSSLCVSRREICEPDEFEKATEDATTTASAMATLANLIADTLKLKAQDQGAFQKRLLESSVGMLKGASDDLYEQLEPPAVAAVAAGDAVPLEVRFRRAAIPLRFSNVLSLAAQFAEPPMYQMTKPPGGIPPAVGLGVVLLTFLVIAFGLFAIVASLSQRGAVALGLLVAVGVVFFVAWQVGTWLRSRWSQDPEYKRRARRVRWVQYSVKWIGLLVVLLSGLSTQYYANSTFGPDDYLGLLAWGFGFGTAVSITKSLLPRVTTS